MIRFFRFNDPYRLVFVFLVLALVRTTYIMFGLPLSWPELKHLLLGEWLASGFKMYTETFDYTAPLSAWTYKGIDWLFGRSRLVHWIISGMLLMFQAASFNQMLLRNKVLSELNYVPAFLYIVFSVAIFDFFALSPQLMSLTFIIISMGHLIRRMDNVASDELFLYPGFYLGIAGMFYMPSTVFFFVFLLAMIVIVGAKPRRILLYVYGWLTSNFIVLVTVYLTGNWKEFWDSYFVEIFRQKIYFVSVGDMLLWMAFPLLIFMLSLVVSLGTREGSLHVKTQQFMSLILIASVGVVSIGGTLSGVDLVFLVPVFTFFLTNYFLKLRHKIWKRVIPNIMILGSLLAPFIGLYFDLFSTNLIVEESERKYSNERVMVIGPLDPLYQDVKMGGPFFDERISKERLKDLDFYNASLVFLNVFQKADPTLVIDDWNRMDKINYRFPEIEKKNIRVVKD